MANGSASNPENQAENPAQLTQEIHWVHRATLWSQVGLGIIGLCALVIYGCQLSVMRGTLAEVRRSGEQSTEQTWSAIGNINWMARSMDSSQKTNQQGIEASGRQSEQALQTAIDNFHQEQRAWVSPAGISGVPTVNQPFIVQTTANNAGKTYAKHFVMYVAVQAAPAGTKLHLETAKGTVYNSLSLLPPNGTYTAKNTVTGEGSVPFVPNPTQEDIDSIKAGTTEIVVFGRMDYLDVFKRPHWAIFCYRLARDLSWISCNEHNDADNN